MQLCSNFPHSQWPADYDPVGQRIDSGHWLFFMLQPREVGDHISFSVQRISFGKRMATRADKAGGDAFGFDIVTIATLFLNMLPQVMQLFALCKKQPPAPPPIPPALESIGVSNDIWKQANGAKFAADQSAGSGEGGFSKIAIARTAKEIAKEQGIKKRAARPLAIAALTTARDESAEELALAMHAAQSNAASLGL